MKSMLARTTGEARAMVLRGVQGGGRWRPCKKSDTSAKAVDGHADT
jgi:hypothetical protein